MGRIKLIIIILILILAGLLLWYWQKKPLPTPTSGLGSRVFEQTQNPVKNILPANPFSNYKNPFAQ